MASLLLNLEGKKRIYFQDDISFDIDDYAHNVIYDFCYKNIESRLYTKRTRLSIIIDLEKDIETIFKDFKHNTRNEINKAKKLNFTTGNNNVDLTYLFEKHNEMLESKGLKKIDKSFYFGLSAMPITTSISTGGGGG